jgi:transposase-like protein
MKQAETEVVMGDEQPRDRKGRRRLTRERRAEVVKEYEGSGLTQAEFARRAGLNATRFAHWVQLSRRDAKAKTLTAFATPRFVEVQAAASMPPAMNAFPCDDAGEVARELPGRRGGAQGRSGGAGHLGPSAACELRKPPMSLPPLGLPANLRIYLAVEPVDMRKQYDGLWALAEQHLRLDPFGGVLFVFINKTEVDPVDWTG